MPSKPPYKRAKRLGDQLRREISMLLLDGVKDPRVHDVCITGVELTADLRTARVFFSCLGDEKRRAEVLVGLRSAATFIQNTASQRLELRLTPRLTFVFDGTLAYAERINELLRDIAVERDARPAAPDEEEAGDG